MAGLLIITFLQVILSGSPGNMVIINTNKNIDLKKVRIYTREGDFHNRSTYQPIHLVKQSKKTFSFQTESNEIFFQYQGCIPYQFTSLGVPMEDTVFIENVRLFKYQPADTIFTTKARNKRDGSIFQRKEKVKVLQKRPAGELPPPVLLVNKTAIAGKKREERIESRSWYCTPGKSAYYYGWAGKEAVFVYDLGK